MVIALLPTLRMSGVATCLSGVEIKTGRRGFDASLGVLCRKRSGIRVAGGGECGALTLGELCFWEW